jgi:small-conductance mechanosensitive channel
MDEAFGRSERNFYCNTADPARAGGCARAGGHACELWRYRLAAIRILSTFMDVKSLMRSHRSLLWGSGIFALMAAIYPWSGNTLALTIFGGTLQPFSPIADAFGIASWILGAWLVKSILSRILRRTIFPNDDQPHARRLFADLASGLVYVIAFVGIMDTVLKEPISTMLATSGVLAIVLGLALQNTLADVFSGLAINIERPFGAGDWITMAGDVEGQVIEINWRATRLRTLANDIVVIPNSVVAKAVVTNHRPLSEPYLCTVELSIDHSWPVARVITVLEAAAGTTAGVAAGSKPVAYANSVTDALVNYRLYFALHEFSQSAPVRSAVIATALTALATATIPVGTAETVIRMADEKKRRVV